MSDKQPADMATLYAAAQRLINSAFNQEPRARMRIPARESDDDFMMIAALDELAAARERLAQMEAWRQAAETYIRSKMGYHTEACDHWLNKSCNCHVDDTARALLNTPEWSGD